MSSSSQTQSDIANVQLLQDPHPRMFHPSLAHSLWAPGLPYQSQRIEAPATCCHCRSPLNDPAMTWRGRGHLHRAEPPRYRSLGTSIQPLLWLPLTSVQDVASHHRARAWRRLYWPPKDPAATSFARALRNVSSLRLDDIQYTVNPIFTHDIKTNHQ